MSIVAIIPARYQSSRFPGKPLADINGKPMIQHVYERAQGCFRLDRLVIATDDRRIVSAVEGFGGEALLTREDHASGTDRVAEACQLLNTSGSDIVVNIQGDEPLVESIMLDCLVEAMESTPDAFIATLAFESTSDLEYHDPNVVKVVVDRNGRALYFSRSPLPYRRDAFDEPRTFLKHMGYYAYRYSFLRTFTELPPGRLENLEKLEQLRALENGFSIQVALSPVETFGVDTPDDLKKVQQLVELK
jgi:3-deoxy-manno-octulosonate cytidylyltransferase (CMP-KDO synthetase)